VTRVAGNIAGSMKFLPKSTANFIARKLGMEHVFLDEVDTARAKPTKIGQGTESEPAKCVLTYASQQADPPILSSGAAGVATAAACHLRKCWYGCCGFGLDAKSVPMQLSVWACQSSRCAATCRYG